MPKVLRTPGTPGRWPNHVAPPEMKLAHPGHAGALVQGKRRRYVPDLVHLCLLRLGHPPPCVSGEGLQVAPGPLRVENSQGQGGLAGSGDPGDRRDLMQGNVNVDVL